MSDNKTTQNNKDVVDFINSVENDKRRQDALKVLDIFSEVTNAKPKMWGSSIIGFGTYHYRYASGREGDFLVTGFSPRKASLTLYILSGFDDYAESSNYNPQDVLDKLGPYKTGKSCLYIKDLDQINIDVLKQLISISVEQMKSLVQQPDTYVTEISIP